MIFFKLFLFFAFISSAIAGDKIQIIGKLLYSKEINTFSVVYFKNERIISHNISVKNRSEFQKLKSLIGRSIKIEGDLNWRRTNQEFFSLKEELSINQISSFELNTLTLNHKEKTSQDNLVSHEKAFKPYRLSTNITVSDKTANGLITASAVALSIAGGPIIAVPAAAFGIHQLFTK